MNRTNRVLTICLLCVGTAAFSFGETFESLDATDWNVTYNANTALFGAVIEQGGSSLQSGLPTGTGTDGNPFTSGSEAFSLTYDPFTGLASLTVGSHTTPPVQTLKVALAGGTLDHIGIALSAGASNEQIAISDLVLNNGAAGTDVLSSNGQGLFDFAMTPPTNFSGAQFTIAGNIDMSWTGDAPGSNLSVEVVGADAVVITPEPGTWALLGSALVGLGMLRRKRIA